jgi:hypothetical protein
MPGPLIDALEYLDAATAATMQSQREKLLSIAEGKGIRVRVAYACAACQPLFAVASLYSGDRRAAAILAIQACIVIGFVLIGARATRRKAIRELQEMKRSA